MRVPVYEYPFVHEELWEFAAARARAAAARALPVLRIQPPLDLPPLPRHWRNFVMVRDADGLWDVVRPAQLLLPVEVAEGDGAVDGVLDWTLPVCCVLRRAVRCGAVPCIAETRVPQGDSWAAAPVRHRFLRSNSVAVPRCVHK